MTESADYTPQSVPEIAALDLLDYGGEPDLVGAAIEHLRTVMPQWTPRAGNTEVALIEAFAVMLAPEILALQMVPGAVVEQLVGLHGVTRSRGSAAEALVRVHVTSSAPIQTVPAGTLLRLQLSETGEATDLETVEPLEILTAEASSGVVLARATDLGDIGNGTPEGTPLDVLSLLPHVESAELAGPLSGGAGPEGDASFMTRAAAVLGRQTSTLVLPEHFQLAAESTEGVTRARVLDLTDPARPGVEAAGHVTVAASGSGGAALPAEDAEALQLTLSSQALASLTVHVVAPTVTPVNVAVTVKAAIGADPAALSAAVEAAIRDWLDPDAWAWEPTITEFGFAAAIAGVSGSAGLLSVESGPQALPGLAPLPRVDTITVVVQ